MSNAANIMLQAAQLLNAGTIAMEQFQALAALGEDITDDDLNNEIDKFVRYAEQKRDDDFIPKAPD